MQSSNLELFFRKAPFFRILLFFITGILLKYYVPVNISSLYLFILTFIFWISLIVLNKISKNIYTQQFFGVCFGLFFILLGYLLTDINEYQVLSHKLPESKELKIEFIAKDLPTECSKTFKVYGNVINYLSDNKKYTCNVPIVLYLEKCNAINNIHPGDKFFVKTYISRIKSFSTDFDYKKYMFRQGYIYSAYSKMGNWENTHTNCLSIWRKISFQCRNYLINVYKAGGLDGRELAVASALTIGYKADLDPEIKHAYSVSGTMHILAVSGLHVGLIFFLLDYFLTLFSFFNKHKIYKLILLLFFIWFYAFLTGLPPSVLRAVLMLTILGIGKETRRSVFVYNTIFSSALLILIFNPFQFFDVGFQLSYLAVLSIVFYYPYIYKWFKIKYFVSDKIWQLSAVSIAAQLGTLPLTLLYFKQFPNLFLFSNILVIPISTFAMYTAIIFLPFTFISVICKIQGFILKELIVIMNKSVLWIESMEFSRISNITISISATLILYLLFISGTFYLIKKKPGLILLNLTLVLLFIWF